LAVPIYDGRDFNFKAIDFDNIRSLPLYKKGEEDLPQYSVVSVGYSVNTYAYAKAGAHGIALSPNILFVIMLGKVSKHALPPNAQK
jgi:hypothetical protein